MRWYVRVPPNANKWPPGFSTRSASRHISTLLAMPLASQALPMKPSS